MKTSSSMKCDEIMKEPEKKNERERRSKGRRSSILKKDTCIISEGSEGGTEGQRTPRRVSFANTNLVRTFRTTTWASDESGSSVGSTSTLSSRHDTDEVFSAGPSSVQGKFGSSNVLMQDVFSPDSSDNQARVLVEGINSLHYNLESSVLHTNERVPDVSSPIQNQTILFDKMNESVCGMDITTDISQSSRSFLLMPDDQKNWIAETVGDQWQDRPGLNCRSSFPADTYSEKLDQMFMETHYTGEMHKPECYCIPSPVKLSSGAHDKRLITRSKYSLLDDLVKAVTKPRQSVPFAAHCEKENVGLEEGPADMEMTGEINQSPLRDITSHKTLTPIEEVSVMSTGMSVSDHGHSYLSNLSHPRSKTDLPNFSQDSCPKVLHLSVNQLNSSCSLHVSPRNKENIPMINQHIFCHGVKTVNAGLNDYEINKSLGVLSHHPLPGPNNGCNNTSMTSFCAGIDDFNNKDDDDEDSEVELRLPLGHEKLYHHCDGKEKETVLPKVSDHRTYSSIQGENKTVHFSHANDMEFTCVHTEPVDIGEDPNSVLEFQINSASSNKGESKELLKKQFYTEDTTEMDLTICQTKTICVFPEVHSGTAVSVSENVTGENVCKDYLKAQLECLQTNNSTHGTNVRVVRDCDHKSSSPEKLGKNNSGHYHNGNALDGEPTHVFDNCQMEMTQGLSKTIHLGDFATSKEQHGDMNYKSLTPEKLGKNTSGFCHNGNAMDGEPTHVFDNYQMEMTQGLSKTIHLGDFATSKEEHGHNNYKSSTPEKLGTNTSDFCHNENAMDGEPSHVFDNYQMEMTQGLSKTIHLGDLATSKEQHGEVNHKSSTPEELGKNVSGFYYTGNGVDGEPTHIFNNYQMEVTQGLSKTIHLGDFATSKEQHGEVAKTVTPKPVHLGIGAVDNNLGISVSRSTSKRELKLDDGCLSVLSNSISVETQHKMQQDHEIISTSSTVCRAEEVRQKNVDASATSVRTSKHGFSVSHTSSQNTASMNTKYISQDPIGTSDVDNHMAGQQNVNLELINPIVPAKRSSCTNTNELLGVKRRKNDEDISVFNDNQGQISEVMNDNMTIINEIEATSGESVSQTSSAKDLSRSGNITIQTEPLDERREAIRKSLCAEMKLPCSLSKRKSNTFDPFNMFGKRRSNNFHLVLGSGAVKQDQRDQVTPENAAKHRTEKEFSITSEGLKYETIDLRGRSESGPEPSIDFSLEQVQGLRETNKLMELSVLKDKSNQHPHVSLPASMEQEDDSSQMMEMDTKKIPSFVYKYTSSSTSSQESDNSEGMKDVLSSTPQQSKHHDERQISDLPSHSHGTSMIALQYSSPGAQLISPDNTIMFEDKGFELSEILDNVMVPDLVYHETSLNEMEQSLLHDIRSVMQKPLETPGKGRNMEMTLEDVYQPLGIQVNKETSAKMVEEEVIPVVTDVDKLQAALVSRPRLDCLNYYVSQMEKEIERARQECKEKLHQFSKNPPEVYSRIVKAQQDGSETAELKIRAQETMEACRMSAQAKWKRHKADFYLMKYSMEKEAIHKNLSNEIQEVVSETDKVLNLTSAVDQCLKLIRDIKVQREEMAKKEAEKEETEREVKALRQQCNVVDRETAELEENNSVTIKQLKDCVVDMDLMEDTLAWMSSLTEWSLLKSSRHELEFSFLFGTIFLHIELAGSDSTSQRIRGISFKSRIAAQSKPWAKLAHTFALSNLDKDGLLEKYGDCSKLSQLLSDVSTVVCKSRQLSSELRAAHLAHQLSIEGNKISLVIRTRPNRRKVQLSATVLPSEYPHCPLFWTVTVLSGNIRFCQLQKAVESVPGCDNYISHVLTAVEKQLK